MCGICGFVDCSGASTLEILHRMSDSIAHRGPDNAGFSYFCCKSSFVGLGHRRLSIIDLSDSANQPMRFDRLEIVFNGEVYNFEELRTELEREGYDFATNSDTEVVLKAFHCWGLKSLDRLIGMFAIVIFDHASQKIFLIRDRAGVKPIYWYYDDNLFLFSSELKSFHKHPSFKKVLDLRGLALFLEHGYIPQPFSIFESVRKIRAGHYLEYDISTRLTSEQCYWDVEKFYCLPKLRITENEALEQIEELFYSSFKYRMVADVPVGVFLSGGIDSSIVTALLQRDRKERLRTFTIGFNESDFNEAPHASLVADYLNTEHTEFYCDFKEAFDILPLLPNIYDEPYGDSSAIPTVLLSRLAKSSVSVCLSADGGDEIFGGYEKYGLILKKAGLNQLIPDFLKTVFYRIVSNPSFQGMINRFGLANAGERLIRQGIALSSNENKLLALMGSYWVKEEIACLMVNKQQISQTSFDFCNCSNSLDRLLCVDFRTYLADDLMPKVDRATMSVGLEAREPMLDHRIVEFVARLPDNMKIAKGTTKILLRKLAGKFLPEAIVGRPKMGFSVPLANWLRGDLKHYVDYYLSFPRIKQAGLFDADFVEDLKSNFYIKNGRNFNKIWLLLVFEMWREKWL